MGGPRSDQCGPPSGPGPRLQRPPAHLSTRPQQLHGQPRCSCCYRPAAASTHGPLPACGCGGGGPGGGGYSRCCCSRGGVSGHGISVCRCAGWVGRPLLLHRACGLAIWLGFGSRKALIPLAALLCFVLQLAIAGPLWLDRCMEGRGGEAGKVTQVRRAKEGAVG